MALAVHEKAIGSKVSGTNHRKSKQAAHKGKPAAPAVPAAPAAPAAEHASKKLASSKPAPVTSSKDAESEVDDRYQHLMNIDWNFFEENKDQIN